MSWLAELIPLKYTPGPLSRHSFFYDLLPPILCYYATAVLVLLPGSFILRLALLPLSLWLAFRGAMRLDLTLGYSSGGLTYLNQGLALSFATISMRVVIWTFQSKPYKRVKTLAEATPQFYDQITSPAQSPGEIAIDALDLCFNLRGCGWNWSHNLQFPKETRPTNSITHFVAATFVSLVQHFVLFDLLHYSVQWFSPCTVGSAKGGTIFDTSLPSSHRYLRSSVMTFSSGLTVYSAIQTCYHICTIIGVVVFRQHPSLWPPAFRSPWLATSLSEFWAKRWHQLFRYHFISLGGYPLSLIAGRAGGVLGSFFISGILHDVGLWGMGNGTDFPRVGGFFLVNGFGILLEHVWRTFSGSRVGGRFGWAWTVMWVIGWGHIIVDAWARSGLVGSRFFPLNVRPSTYVFGVLPSCDMPYT